MALFFEIATVRNLAKFSAIKTTNFNSLIELKILLTDHVVNCVDMAVLQSGKIGILKSSIEVSQRYMNIIPEEL